MYGTLAQNLVARIRIILHNPFNVHTVSNRFYPENMSHISPHHKQRDTSLMEPHLIPYRTS